MAAPRHVLVLFALVACGKGSEPAPTQQPVAAETATSPVHTTQACPPLDVTVDGAPITGLVHGHAVDIATPGTHEMIHQVALLNHDEVTCEDALRGIREPPRGEVLVRAFGGGRDQGVAIEAFTQLEQGVVVEQRASEIGKPSRLCVSRPIVFTPTIGDYKDKRVSIAGTFEAAYCGVMK